MKIAKLMVVILLLGGATPRIKAAQSFSLMHQMTTGNPWEIDLSTVVVAGALVSPLVFKLFAYAQNRRNLDAALYAKSSLVGAIGAVSGLYLGRFIHNFQGGD